MRRSRIRRRVRAAAVAAAAVAVVATMGCAELVTERAFAPVSRHEPDPDATIEPAPPVEGHIVHLRLSGDANQVRWRCGDREVVVRAPPHSTKCWLFGPILPVIPSLGTTLSRELEIDAWAAGGDRPLRANLADFVLRLPGRVQPVAPTSALVPASEDGLPRGVAGDEGVLTGRRISFRLRYPVDPREVATAEVVVRFATADGTWEFVRSARLERSETTILRTTP